MASMTAEADFRTAIRRSLDGLDRRKMYDPLAIALNFCSTHPGAKVQEIKRIVMEEGERVGVRMVEK
jgi:hypothetical protein